MPETVQVRPWPTRLAVGAGAFIAALGLIVMVGWLSHTPALIQFGSQLPPMTRNAAASSLLCGLALLMVVLGGPRWLAVSCAGIVSALSLLTVLEFVFGVSVGIDDLLGTPYIPIRVSSPGRMAPLTAICFALGSMGLLMAPRILSKRYSLFLGLTGSIIAAAGITTCMAFALGSSENIGWGHDTRASLLAAVALCVFGLGLVALAWRVETDQVGIPRWLPISVGIGVATGSVGLWQALMGEGYRPFALVPAVALGGGVLMAPIFGLTVYLAQRAHSQAAALRQSEARKSAILDSALDCILTIDHVGRITEFNLAAERTFGYRRDDVVGKELADVIIPPSLREQHRQGFARYLATGNARVLGKRVEMTAVHADGNEFPVELTITRIPWDGPPAFTGYLRDITKRKHSEEALKRSERFLAEAQRLSSIGSLSWRVPTNDIIWSEQLYRIFEFDQSVSVTLDLISTRVHPEDIPLLNDMIDQARRGVSDFEYEHRLLMPDHSVKFLQMVAHGTPDPEGRMEYIGAIQDVTDRRLSEEALSEVRSELAHMTRVMSLGTLTASIAHEVNQPLSGIITNASTCLRMLDAEPPNVDGARQTAQRTIRDGHRASDVITRLRALFSKRDGTTEAVDLNEAIREVIALSRSELQRNQVISRIELADYLPTVTGDRVQLQQVVLNLLLNAADAMREIDERPRQLIVRTERADGDQVRLSVQDAGVGFGPQGVDKLFEPFYTTKSGGMGIGLAVSRSIIENHHGRLWATPNEGPGATFSFSIPCSAAV